MLKELGVVEVLGREEDMELGNVLLLGCLLHRVEGLEVLVEGGMDIRDGNLGIVEDLEVIEYNMMGFNCYNECDDDF